MRHVLHAVLATGFMVAVTAPARADDAADARALVEKAIKAQGGDEKLSKFAGHTVKFKGTFHGMGQELPITGQIMLHGPNQQKADLELDVGGQKIRVVNVLNGDKGWAKVADNLMELDKDQLAEAKEQGYAGWVGTLAPLKDKAFTLATIGEIKVDDKPALGVKVSRKGHRDVDLYFDKATGLLVKTETRVKDEGSGQEVTEESFASGYKEVQGTKQAMKFVVKRDGKLFIEGDVIEMELSEKLDASNFAKP